MNNRTIFPLNKLYASRMYDIRCQPGEQSFLPNVTKLVTVELGIGFQPVENVSLFNETKLGSCLTLPRNVLKTWISCSLHAGEVDTFLETLLFVTGNL